LDRRIWKKCKLTAHDNKDEEEYLDPKEEEVSGRWRKSHNKKLYYSRFVPNTTVCLKTGTTIGRSWY